MVTATDAPPCSTDVGPYDTRGRVLPLTRAGIWVLLDPRRGQRPVPVLRPRRRRETDYAWSIKPPVNAAFIGAGFLAGHARDRPGAARSRPAGARSRRCRSRCGCSRRRCSPRRIIHNDRFKFDYPPTWVWTFVYAACRSRSRSSSRASAANADAEPAGRPAAATSLRVVCGVFGVAILIAGAIALFVAPVDLGKHWLWPLTPLLARAVAAWYALFGTMLSVRDRHAPPGRGADPLRDARAAGACSSCCCRVLHPDDVSGGGALVRADGGAAGARGLRAAASACRSARTSRRRRRWRARRARERASAARASSRDTGARNAGSGELGRARPRPTAPGSPCGTRARGGRGGEELM